MASSECVLDEATVRSGASGTAVVVTWSQVRETVVRYLPRPRHFRGSVIHRVLGRRVFDRQLWTLSRSSAASGLAVGLFIALTPTLGIQVILAALAAYFLRVNVPLAVLACLITNPLTAPIIYPLQYQLGVWISGSPGPDELEGYSGVLRNFARYARPLWVGSLVSGLLFAVVGYATVYFAWAWTERLWNRMHAAGGSEPGARMVRSRKSTSGQ